MPGHGPRLDDEVDVRDYLTGGDKINQAGSHDVAYAVQRAIDEAIASTDKTTTVRRALRKVNLPAGLIPLSVPITVESVVGFELAGVGGATRLCPFDGATTMTCLVDLNGTANSSFHDFSITGRGSTTVDKALWVRWNGVYRSSTQNELRNIRVGDLRYKDAFVIGDPANAGVQVDQTNWFNCLAYGQATDHATLWRSGFHVGEGTFGNNLIHSMFGCGSASHKWNVWVDACQLGWFGGIVQTAAVDFFVNGASYFRVAGTRSEHSARLLETGGPATFTQQITLDDIEWRVEFLHADGHFVKVRCGGFYKLRNIQIPRVVGKTPTVLGDGAGAQLIEVDGVATTTAVGDFIAGTSSNGQSVIRSYIQIDSGGAASVLTVN